jgi:hypothetical protein
MRREPEFFGDRELSLIYVARKLNDALRVEDLLTGFGIDYAVEADKYWVGTIFRRERVGAFFYVPPDVEDTARQTLRQARFEPYRGDLDLGEKVKG